MDTPTTDPAPQPPPTEPDILTQQIKILAVAASALHFEHERWCSPGTKEEYISLARELLKDSKAGTGKKFLRMYQNQEQKSGELVAAMQAIMREPRFLNNDDVWVTVTSEHTAGLREQFKDALEHSLSTGVKNV